MKMRRDEAANSLSNIRRIKSSSAPGVHDISLAMYPFSNAADEHAPLQHFNR